MNPPSFPLQHASSVFSLNSPNQTVKIKAARSKVGRQMIGVAVRKYEQGWHGTRMMKSCIRHAALACCRPTIACFPQQHGPNADQMSEPSSFNISLTLHQSYQVSPRFCLDKISQDCGKKQKRKKRISACSWTSLLCETSIIMWKLLTH